ncbi:HNH endonuclease signature motif containing protein [Sphingomonas sp. IW22]|uniref:HNH endonuclease signature motif containing protein n=1 Tax=Sphingomonas sp. IW22 TaxID=3242489 RepID=UPI0035229F81
MAGRDDRHGFGLTAPVERLRGRAGQRQRLRRLRRTNGLCEHCLKEERVTIAAVVNHIVPLIQGGSDEDSNTENLCAAHDREATARQFGFDVALGARGVGKSGRPTSSHHAWAGPAPTTASIGRRRPTPPRGGESLTGQGADTAPLLRALRERFQSKKFG